MKVYLWSSSWKIRAEILKQKAQSGMADSSCLDKNRRELRTHAELKGKCKQDSHFRISPCCPVSALEGLLMPSAGYIWDFKMKSTQYSRVSLDCGFGDSSEKKNEKQPIFKKKKKAMEMNSRLTVP